MNVVLSPESFHFSIVMQIRKILNKISSPIILLFKDTITGWIPQDNYIQDAHVKKKKDR
jgi:hypothetical protein